MAGGVCAAALVKVLTLGDFGVANTLAPGISNAQGLFIEMFTTGLLCFTYELAFPTPPIRRPSSDPHFPPRVLMCAAEKSKRCVPVGVPAELVQWSDLYPTCSAFLAPVAIGLALFIGHLGSIGWTGAGENETTYLVLCVETHRVGPQESTPPAPSARPSRWLASLPMRGSTTSDRCSDRSSQPVSVSLAHAQRLPQRVR